MADKSTVFVVDDDENARQSVCALVRSMGIHTQAFSSGEAFLEQYIDEDAGCLVADVRMPGMSGLDLQEKLIERRILLPVILLTAYARTRLTVRGMKAGAVTLIEKPYDEEELWDAIRKALAIDGKRRVLTQRRCEIQHRASLLTPGEREVMDLIVRGEPNKRIAQKLDLSVRAIENRRHAVFQKIHAGSLAELVRLVIEGDLDAESR